MFQIVINTLQKMKQSGGWGKRGREGRQLPEVRWSGKQAFEKETFKVGFR